MQFKLQIDMFDNEKIKIIQARPKGDTLLILWIRLIVLAEKSNAGGLVQLEDGVPYTAKMLAVVFGKSLRMINLALTTFEELRMIKNTTEGICIISENQDSKEEREERIREQNRIRKQRERRQKKEAAAQTAERENVTEMSRSVTEKTVEMSRDKSRNKDEKERTKEKEEKEIKEISSKEDIKKSPREPLEYQRIMDDYSRTCTSLTPIFTVSDARKRKIRALIDSMDKDKILPDKSAYERLHTLFETAQLSDFLSGRSGCWTGCSFDWLIDKANALKVLEGTYNKPSRTKPSETHSTEKRPANRFAGFPQRNYSEQDYRKMEEILLAKDMLATVAPVQC